MAAAAPAPQKNRGSLEFKITSAASTDHDYVVIKVPDLAPFQSVLDYCATHFEAKDHKTCVIQTKGTYALRRRRRRRRRCCVAAAPGAGVPLCRCWCRCWCF